MKDQESLLSGGDYPGEREESTLISTLLQIWMKVPLSQGERSADPKLSFWIKHTSCEQNNLEVLCKRTVDTYSETGYGKPRFFFLDNTIPCFRYLK